MLTMDQEAKLIERVLRRIAGKGRRPGYVLPPPVSFQSSKARLYYLGGLDYEDPEKIARQLEGPLSQLLTVHRNAQTAVRIAQLPLRVEVPRPESDLPFLPLLDMLKLLKGRGNGRPLLGLGETYNFDQIAVEKRNPKPVMVDLADPATPHVLLAATTGGGKTRLLKAMIFMMAAATGPQDLSIVIIDPKGLDFRGFSIPHLACPVAATDPVRIEKTLWGVLQEMERRKGLADRFPTSRPHAELLAALGPYIVVFVDELAEMVETCSQKTQLAIKRLAAVARGLKIHLVLGTQRPTADSIDDIRKSMSNIPVRITGKVAEKEHAKAITGLRPNLVAAHTLTTGDFMLVVNGRLRRFHAFGVGDEDIPEFCKIIGLIWQGQPRAWSLDLSKVTIVEPATAQGATQNAHDQIKRYIEEQFTKTQALPTSTMLRKWHKKTFHRSLNYNTAEKLLSEVREGLYV